MWKDEGFWENGCRNLDFDLVAVSEASFWDSIALAKRWTQGVFVVETAKFFCKQLLR